MDLKEKSLLYHKNPIPGKIATKLTKRCETSEELSLAYTPGVAYPCLEIEKEENLVYDYTNKGNLVAVITNGTAVLGLGDIGSIAGKPVMEGKGVLFKKFADVDVFDIEINEKDPELFINIVEKMADTFGGINLEDIKAPECFYIEEELQRRVDIPVFHDDQHGTAIITGAALINGLYLSNKKIDEIKVVFNGAGASAIACAKHYINLGVKRENIIMCDSKGVLRKDRNDLNEYKMEFATDINVKDVHEALKDADVFVGLSVGNILTEDDIKKMSDYPMIFALANPHPEIPYGVAKRVRKDAIVATGRSDYPNQVNNVLGFPFIFRGALDVRSKKINEEMKMAATMALANLAREDVPDDVIKAYGGEKFSFGPDYIIPKPFDKRVFVEESSAVAKAAMESGVSRINIDIENYREELKKRIGL